MCCSAITAMKVHSFRIIWKNQDMRFQNSLRWLCCAISSTLFFSIYHCLFRIFVGMGNADSLQILLVDCKSWNFFLVLNFSLSLDSTSPFDSLWEIVLLTFHIFNGHFLDWVDFTWNVFTICYGCHPFLALPRLMCYRNGSANLHFYISQMIVRGEFMF